MATRASSPHGPSPRKRVAEEWRDPSYRRWALGPMAGCVPTDMLVTGGKGHYAYRSYSNRKERYCFASGYMYVIRTCEVGMPCRQPRWRSKKERSLTVFRCNVLTSQTEIVETLNENSFSIENLGSVATHDTRFGLNHILLENNHQSDGCTLRHATSTCIGRFERSSGSPDKEHRLDLLTSTWTTTSRALAPVVRSSLQRDIEELAMLHADVLKFIF